ncbi:hypothetical protein MD484_g8895, partial [Candolleomyces efflorescens]
MDPNFPLGHPSDITQLPYGNFVTDTSAVVQQPGIPHTQHNPNFTGVSLDLHDNQTLIHNLDVAQQALAAKDLEIEARLKESHEAITREYNTQWAAQEAALLARQAEQEAALLARQAEQEAAFLARQAEQEAALRVRQAEQEAVYLARQAELEQRIRQMEQAHLQSTPTSATAGTADVHMAASASVPPSTPRGPCSNSSRHSSPARSRSRASRPATPISHTGRNSRPGTPVSRARHTAANAPRSTPRPAESARLRGRSSLPSSPTRQRAQRPRTSQNPQSQNTTSAGSGEPERTQARAQGVIAAADEMVGLGWLEEGDRGEGEGEGEGDERWDEDEEEEEEEGEEDEEEKKKKRRFRFQLKNVDVPSDVSGVKKALILHVRMLWKMLSPSDLPQDPSLEAIERFSTTFKTSNALDLQRRSSSMLININHVRGMAFLARSTASKSKIVNMVSTLEENYLEYIDAYIARFGMDEWCPDLRQSPNSLWNSACRIIALDTFKQGLVTHAYAALKPNQVYVHNMEVLTRLYDHIVHFYFQQRYTRNAHNPGSVQAVDETNPTYRNRLRLAKARQKFLELNGYPQRYLSLANAKATSDDEKDPDGTIVNGRPVFFIKTRPERSVEATRFFRILDAKREREARLDPSRRWKERIRQEPEVPVETQFLSIPLGMPIDYFDPGFFNELQPKLQAKATNLSLALLPNIEDSLTGCSDEILSDEDFTAKYSADVFPKYNVVEEPEDDSMEETGDDFEQLEYQGDEDI